MYILKAFETKKNISFILFRYTCCYGTALEDEQKASTFLNEYKIIEVVIIIGN